MILEYRLREGAKKPDRANPSDAGLDVFYCPKDPSVSAVTINPGENHLLPTGLSFGIPHGYMLQVCNRSSMGAKKSLVVGAHIVDSGYDGEVFIALHNIGKETQHVVPGEKVAQLVLVPVVHFRAKSVHDDSDDLYETPITISDRGAGALGSTNKKTSKSAVDNAKLTEVLKDWMPNGF